MLMPDKHIKFAESLIGLSSFVLESLDEPSTIDELWEKYKKARKQGLFPANHSFENLVLSVDTLYAIGAVRDIEGSGVLQLCA